MNKHLRSLRSIRKVNQHVNRIRGEGGVDKDAFDTKLVEGMFEMYSLEFMMLDPKLDTKHKFVELLKLLTNISDNFKDTFIRTVDNIPGMRYYLISHTIFKVDDNRESNDWFTKFMIHYLRPTDEEVNEYMGNHSKCSDKLIKYGVDKSIAEKLEIFSPELIHQYDDDIILEFGMWNRDDDGRVKDVISVTDTGDLPSTVARKIDVEEIMRMEGVLNMSTGEIIVEPDYSKM